MDYPKLKTRPMSTQVCTNFRGLDRRPGASSKVYNKSWRWYWHDERNLSADRYPRLCVRNAHKWVQYIDGNSFSEAIVAACGGDHLVLLDSYGGLWSNGGYLDLHSAFAIEVAWTINVTPGQSVSARLAPKTGYDASGTALGGLTNIGGAATKIVTFRVSAVNGSGVPTAWECNKTGVYQTGNPSSYGITVTLDGPVDVGWSFYVQMWKRMDCAHDTQLVRMGANVILFYQHDAYYWVNAVKLASGATMTAGTDYGMVAGAAASSSLSLSLSICDLDGNAYSGVVVSATEPTQDGYWLDTSSDTPVLQEWSVSQSMWVRISSTYVKISTFANDATLDGIRAGDTVALEAKCANGTDASVAELLNMTHYLYGADVGGSGYIIVAGILPSDSVSVTLTENATAKRTPPQMDFVVEAQNRLWGCRYDESKSINEIYASALGDFKNWEVYQGISTDAWRASRGTAAPFTGAITYGGYPLFFREESLEKVFPSATGAHQIAVYALEGVQKGCADSMVIIDERLFYKGRSGVCVYAGTLPSRISEEFGDWTFENAKAGRHGRKYVVCMDWTGGTADGVAPSLQDERLCMVYDTQTGDWHVEDEAWSGLCVTWNDALYHTMDFQPDENMFRFAGGTPDGISWWAESDELSLELPEHKWVYCVRLRFKLDLQAECRVYIAYDGGDWERKGTLHGNRLGSNELNIWPRRCDHFRVRLEGTGGCELQSISYRVERSEGGN